MEIWKDVKGFEGLYLVSSFGRVKRVEHESRQRNYGERIKKTGKDKDGYITVMLYKGRKQKLCKVHRLVAEAFIPNPTKLPMINHKDETRENNSVSNLEWCDSTYNNNYGTRNQRLSKTKKLWWAERLKKGCEDLSTK